MGNGGRGFAPDAGEGGLDFLLEAGDQFAVGGDQRLLGFELGDDGLQVSKCLSLHGRRKPSKKRVSQCMKGMVSTPPCSYPHRQLLVNSG